MGAVTQAKQVAEGIGAAAGRGLFLYEGPVGGADRRV